MEYKIIDVSTRKGNNFNNLIGDVFGRLTVIGLSERKSGRKSYWVCKCSCGNYTEVRSDILLSHNTESCGCLKIEQDIKNLGIVNNHKMTKHPLYRKWNSMMQRCYNDTQERYYRYGGRGIIVCNEWHDVKKFVEWSEKNGYQEGLSIERINNNGNYEPSNCKWVTLQEQHYNKSTSVFHEYNGERLTTMQWQRKLNIPLSKVSSYKSKGIEFLDLIRQYYKDNTEINK